MDSKFNDLRHKILSFRDQRDWAQYHDPQNLAAAISIEAAELQEVFLWLTTEESRHLSPAAVDRVKEEAADIFIFLIYLCDAFNIDLLDAVEAKLSRNEMKYPVQKSKGLSTKYTEL